MINRAADLALHAHTALPLALATQMSDVTDFYQSSAFGNYRKAQEHRQKASVAMFGRLDGLAKQLQGLGKLLTGRR